MKVKVSTDFNFSKMERGRKKWLMVEWLMVNEWKADYRHGLCRRSGGCMPPMADA